MDEKVIMPEEELMHVAVKELQKKGYNVIFIALYGAQNYNLKRSKSDYDYKAVVVPSLRDIVFNSKPVSLVEEMPFNGQVDVKDVRLIVDQWKKGASNFVELLYSDWFWVNPDYSPMFWFILNRDAIAHANEESALKAIVGQIKEKFNALDHPYPVQVEEVEKYGYASKQLSHEMRLLAMLSRFKQEDYAYILNPFKGSDLNMQKYWGEILGVKDRQINYSAAQAKNLGKRIVEEADAWLAKYREEGLNFDQSVLDSMDEQKFLIIKRALSDEIWRNENVQ